MINASNISAGRAIERCLIYINGCLDQMRENPEHAAEILSIYLEGEPGVGKSSVVKRIAELLGYKFVDIRANMLNPDDAGGTRMQDMETRTTAWFPPDWMPAVNGEVEGINEKGPYKGEKYRGTMLFFDELASADDRVRKPLFGVFLDRELNGRRLPKNCIVMAAGNEADTGTMVFELDNATRTRFITLRIVADFASWESEYAPRANITPTVISCLKQNIHRFCETERAADSGNGLYGNPRSWEHASIIERSIMKTSEDRRDDAKKAALHDFIAGKLGTELAAEYMGVFENVAEMANLYDIMKANKEDRKKLWPKSIGQLYALTYSMMSYPTDIEMGKKMIDLADEMPEDSEIPFKEMRAPLIEVILKRLKGMGINANEVTKAFKSRSEASTQDIFAAGPLIKLT